jgi:hypothetical protein
MQRVILTARIAVDVNRSAGPRESYTDFQSNRVHCVSLKFKFVVDKYALSSPCATLDQRKWIKRIGSKYCNDEFIALRQKSVHLQSHLKCRPRVWVKN